VSIRREELEARGIDVTAGVYQVVKSLAEELEYDEMLEVFSMIEEEYGDSVFTEMVKSWATNL